MYISLVDLDYKIKYNIMNFLFLPLKLLHEVINELLQKNISAIN